MAIDTYDDLKTEIADHLDRDDLATKIDTFIDLAEARHKRDLRMREMIRRSTADASGRYLALPSSFIGMRTLRLLTDPVTVLQEVNLYEMNRIRSEDTGKPTWYTVHEEIEFNKTPDDTYTAEMIYYAEFTALSDSNTTNALLARAPDAYLYGALISAEPYLWNDERVTLWAQFYRAAVDRLNGMDRKRAGPLVSRVVGRGP